MGSPEFALYPFYQLLANGHEIAAVYTRQDKSAGRGLAPAETPVKKAALALNLNIVQEPTLKNPQAVQKLAAFQPEAIVVAAFGQLVPQPVLDLPLYGCLNIHPSLLPLYRGASPVPAAILAGDEFAGVSLMRLDAGWDTGPIFGRAQIPILPLDTAGSLTAKLFRIGAQMLLEVLAALPAGRLKPRPQDATRGSYSPEIAREQGRIDWRHSAVEIWRQVRAYQPWPGAYTLWRGKQLKVLEAVPLVGVPDAEPGQVVLVTTSGGASSPSPGVATGNGILGLLKLQIEGKRTLTAEEFLRGQRDFAGDRLG